jgi:cyclopropane fatty-acyl-phospholipid synthase-like methyltransferase
MDRSDEHPIYNQAYYQSANYQGYDGPAYRAYHLVRYGWLGLIYKLAFGVKSILDVGCATGMSVWVFRRLLGLEAYGVDVSPYAITNGVSSIRSYLACADLTVEALRFPRTRFDLVVSYDAFEHMPEEALPHLLNRIFALTDKAIFGIYVLDEPIAMWHNWFHKPHPDHLCEHTSAWWIDRFSTLGYVATHLPLARRGSLLVRPRPTL